MGESKILKRLKALQFANPMDIAEKLEEARVWERPGSVELNSARVIGTSLQKIRTMRAECKELDEFFQAMESAKGAEVLAKMETGEINTKTADRLMYVNLREIIEAPKFGKQELTAREGAIVEMADVQALMALKDQE